MVRDIVVGLLLIAVGGLVSVMWTQQASIAAMGASRFTVGDARMLEERIEERVHRTLGRMESRLILLDSKIDNLIASGR